MSVQTQIDRISGAVQSALAALTEKGVTVPAGTKVDGLAALIAAIEAGGGGAVGEIFGTSKYQVGSVISYGSSSISIPTPSWFSDVNKLNVIAFTLPTYGWDTAYATVFLKIIRETVTFSGYSGNDTCNFTKDSLKISPNGDKLQIGPSGLIYMVYGYEYFYILWENE